ncbi:MAG TPA: hypothetical protein VNU24_00155 [Solirubrobacteraceae bacterium]|nr:hypothetical protein [Solirubrobacteraceae bacterium]
MRLGTGFERLGGGVLAREVGHNERGSLATRERDNHGGGAAAAGALYLSVVPTASIPAGTCVATGTGEIIGVTMNILAPTRLED